MTAIESGFLVALATVVDDCRCSAGAMADREESSPLHWQNADGAKSSWRDLALLERGGGGRHYYCRVVVVVAVVDCHRESWL